MPTMVTAPRNPGPLGERDYSKCDVCGQTLDTDRMHVMVDNGMIIRNVYAHRRHRYVTVVYEGRDFVQERTDRELEHLANEFRRGNLEIGWE